LQTLPQEARILKDLKSELGFPEFRFLFEDDEYNAIVLNLLGPNLETLFETTSYKFSVPLHF